MSHSFPRVIKFEFVSEFTLRVSFDDETEQVIDFAPMLSGTLYGPLRDHTLFGQVRIDPEAHTLVWPNGADFDPEILHDWPERGAAMRALARRW